MANWKNQIIENLGEVVGGATPSTKNDENYGGTIPWITPKDLSNHMGRYILHGERNITQQGFNSCSARMLPKGSVLFTSRAPIGYIAIAATDLCTNQGFKSIIPSPQTDGVFLYYLLKYNKDKIEAAGSGTTFKEISGAVMRKISVSVPSFMEQKSIGAILSSIDDKIELNNRININMEAQAQAIYKSWFVDFEPFQDGEFVDSELGQVPKGWQVVNFTSIVEVLGGGTPKTDNDHYWNGDIPFFTPKDATTSYTLETEKYITKDGLSNCNTKLYPINSIFITARGTVGKLALAGREMAMNQSCYALKAKEGYSQFFVYGLAKEVVDLLKHKASGAVFDAIVTRDFDKELVIVPPKPLVDRYTDVVAPLYTKILMNSRENRTLSSLRDTLLPKLMSGEIEVPIV